MIPSIQFQSCNDTVSTIHKDIFEKFDLSAASSPNHNEDIQLSAQAAQFDSDQILMHQVDFNESTIAISSQDCHSIEVETADEMIAACNDHNIVNYTIIGNGLILIEGSQMDFDEDTKDGIDLLVTVNSEDANKTDVEKEMIVEMKKETEIDEMPIEMKFNVNESVLPSSPSPQPMPSTPSQSNETNDARFMNGMDKKAQSDIETRTAIASIEEDIGDEDDGSSSEHELTNLGWLIDLKNLAQWPVDSAHTSNKKHSNGNSHSSLVNGISNCIMNDIDDDDNITVPAISEKDLSEERFKKFTIQVKQSQKNYAERERIYKMDPMEKPPFNYAQIIAMAMMDRGRMTLKDICKWIQEHFAYFRCNKNWNNSIRHNLSLHFCFTKIARDKTEKGKGGYWELSMNATKSEKKRIRNRRKHRDDCGRVYYSHRSRLAQRKNAQKAATMINSKPLESATKLKPTLNMTTNDSCNVSSTSDGSSSICSANGLNDDAPKPISWSTISGLTNAHFIQSLQNVVHNSDHLNPDLISDVITNDMIIINGADLDQSDNEMIHCNFDKTPSQTTIDSYFADQESQQHHLTGANENVLIESNLSTAILNDSSNETFIKSGMDHQSNLLSNATITTTIASAAIAASASTSNVIVEPMPYSLSHMDTVIDIEHEFGHLVNMPDPELTVDGFFDYSSW